MPNFEHQIFIGMPVYNGEKFIAKAIDSLLAQTYPNFELIISDNASTDQTEAICRNYAAKDRRIRYVRQLENMGASANFQYVLNEAAGEYFMWAAADDMWDKTWLQKLLNIFSNETFIAFGSVVNVDKNGRLIKRYKLNSFSGARILRLCRYFMEEDRKGKANFIYGLYNLDRLRKIIFSNFEFNRYGEDMRFVFTCLQEGNISTDKNTFLYKRVPYEINRDYELKKIVKKVLIIDRINTYARYPASINNKLECLIIYFLFPIKYLFSMIYNLVYYFKN